MDDHRPNTGSVAIPSGTLFTDNLAQTIAGTNFGNTLGSFTVTGAGVSLGYTSPTLTGSANNLAAGATVTVTYSGTVVSQSVLNGPPAITTIDNTVVPSGSTTCNVDCTTNNPLTPKADVSKSVTVNGVSGDGTAVKPGDVLAWTITVRNTGSVAIPSGTLFTDNLAQTIAGTNFGNTLGSFTVTGAGVSLGYTSPTLTGSANNLAAGASVTVTYSGTVSAQSVLNGPPAITTIDNTVVPSGSTHVCLGLHDEQPVDAEFGHQQVSGRDPPRCRPGGPLWCACAAG